MGDVRQRVPDTNYANPKITIKAHFVKPKGQGARCMSGNPKKKKRLGATIGADLVRGKGPKGGDKIYRLPSISKCLEHEILPRSSLMLKQICEIASSNQGFIKTHFDEFIKKKAMTMLSSRTSTPIPQPGSDLKVDGNQKERQGRKKMGVTNLVL